MTEELKSKCSKFGLFGGFGIGEKIPVRCRCSIEREDSERKRAALNERIENMRRRGFVDSQSMHMRFQNDLGYNPSVTEKCKRYVDNFQKMQEENVGLIFTGGVGTGKTFYAACIVNALIEKGIMSVMTSLSRIIRTPFDEYESALALIERAGLVVFDDIGSERDTSFAWERAFDAVDARIRSRKPLIVTTNLSPEAMGSASDIRERRIFDRVLGSCVMIPVVGKSIREIEHKQKNETARDILLGK